MTYILFKMADDHMENQNYSGLLNYKDLIPPSEDESENNPTDSDLLEVVNEHNEVLGVVQNPTNFANLSEGRSEENYDYHPPPVPDNMFSSSESETSDTPDYILESSDDDIEVNIQQVRLPLKNYSRDTEHPDDFENNWLWLHEDTGASYGPFTGMPGLNIQPNQRDPLGYFHLFFDPSMYTRIAGQTNEYAMQRYRKLTGHFLLIILDIYSTFTR